MSLVGDRARQLGFSGFGGGRGGGGRRRPQHHANNHHHANNRNHHNKNKHKHHHHKKKEEDKDKEKKDKFTEKPVASIDQAVHNYGPNNQQTTVTGNAVTGPATNANPWGQPIGNQPIIPQQFATNQNTQSSPDTGVDWMAGASADPASQSQAAPSQAPSPVPSTGQSGSQADSSWMPATTPSTTTLPTTDTPAPATSYGQPSSQGSADNPWGEPMGAEAFSPRHHGHSQRQSAPSVASPSSGQAVYDPQQSSQSGAATSQNAVYSAPASQPVNWNAPAAPSTQSLQPYNSMNSATSSLFGSGTSADTSHPFYDPQSSYWQGGTGQAPASNLFAQQNTEVQRQYSNQNPEGFYMYWLGQQGLGGMDARSQAAQSMYRDVAAGYGAAKVNNAELDFADYLSMWNIQGLLDQMTYGQLGMDSGGDIGGRNRWGMRAV